MLLRNRIRFKGGKNSLTKTRIANCSIGVHSNSCNKSGTSDVGEFHGGNKDSGRGNDGAGRQFCVGGGIIRSS